MRVVKKGACNMFAKKKLLSKPERVVFKQRRFITLFASFNQPFHVSVVLAIFFCTCGSSSRRYPIDCSGSVVY